MVIVLIAVDQVKHPKQHAMQPTYVITIVDIKTSISTNSKLKLQRWCKKDYTTVGA
jgi:hypothetical protein